MNLKMFLCSFLFIVNSFLYPFHTGISGDVCFFEAMRRVKATDPGDEICSELLTVNYNRFAHDVYYLREIYRSGIDTLSEILFWKKIIQSPKESLFVSIYPSRKILFCISTERWQKMEQLQKKFFKDSIRLQYGIDSLSKIFVTSGKNYFYDFTKSVPLIEKGMYEFYLHGVDPWYAQAILLIESPNAIQKSRAGAMGAFQLMKKVARIYGLKVSRTLDERKDFHRSAYAAAMLLKNVCIPKAREICDWLGFCAYNEKDLWFRLLVMHIYHAGYGNVLKAIRLIENPRSDMSLIFQLWKIQAAGFRNASQNYSQIILASHLVLYELTGISKIL